MLLKKYEQAGEVSDKDFEFFDDKKIAQMSQREKKPSTDALKQSYKLNQTMPVPSSKTQEREQSAAFNSIKSTEAKQANKEPDPADIGTINSETKAKPAAELKVS